MRGPAAVDGEKRACHRGRHWCRKINSESRDFLDSYKTLGRLRLEQDVANDLFFGNAARLGRVGNLLPDQRSQDVARADRVDRDAVRAEIGSFRTVWGVKRKGADFSWELYFYDYERLERRVSIERVLGALAPFAPSSLSLSPLRPYFMFSIDIDAALGERRRSIEEISVYLGNPSSVVSSGLCYQLAASGLRFDNLYYFFDARDDWDDIVGKVASALLFLALAVIVARAAQKKTA